MDEIERLIEGRERLISIFGYWPSFHDAEVIDFNLWRGEINPETNRYVLPVLTTKIHLWELTSEVDAHGYLVRRHETLVTLRFYDVDDLRMADFNAQNAIFSLGITPEERGKGFPTGLRVEFRGANGINANLFCSQMEVVDAKPWPSSS